MGQQSTIHARLSRSVTIVILIAASAFAISFHEASAEERVTTFDTFNTREPVIALTFDVTFDRGDGVMILDTLADENVQATFAITGLWAQDNPDLMRRIFDEGHHLINHTWDHPSLTGEYTGSRIHPQSEPLSHEQIASQLQRTEDLVRQQLGVELQPYVRPPYGDYDETVLAAMADAGYTYNIMWTADTFGWYSDPVDIVQQRAIDAARPGANILMHVGHGATDGEALPGIIERLRARGYRFATVEDFVDGNLGRSEASDFPSLDQESLPRVLHYWERVGGPPWRFTKP